MPSTTSQLPHLIPSRHPPSAIFTSGGNSSRFAKSPPTRHTALYHNYTPRRAPGSGSGSPPSDVKMSFYSCSASSHEGLVENLRKTGVIRSDAVFDAMKKTDRAKYMAQIETPDGGHVGELACYADSPHPIGYNQTISAPHMHAHALELGYAAIKDVEKPRILDVGAGSGYLTACFGHLVESKSGAHVFGVEIVSGLAQFARKNLQSADAELVDSGVVSVHCCNGWDGLPNESPFHFIHVGAAANIAPQALLDQLADGGRLVIPLDEERGGQMLVEITRNGNIFSQRKLMGVCYVPLVRGRRPSV